MSEPTASCPYCLLDESDMKVPFSNPLTRFIEDARFQGALKDSGVIIPVQHRRTVFDLTEEEIAATFQLLGVVKSWMDETFEPAGYNIGWNCEATGGQTVLHAHMHVIPRFPQEPLAGQGIRALLKSDANRW